MKPTPEQIAKLPGWARTYIAGLESLAASSRAIAEAAHGTIDTPIELNPYRVHFGEGMKRQFLPADATVRFGLNIGPHMAHVDIRIDQHQQRLQVHATMGSGDRWLDVRPEAANAFTIGFGRK